MARFWNGCHKHLCGVFTKNIICNVAEDIGKSSIEVVDLVIHISG